MTIDGLHKLGSAVAVVAAAIIPIIPAGPYRDLLLAIVGVVNGGAIVGSGAKRAFNL